MPDTIVLQPIGVTKSGTEKGITYYQVLGKDDKDNTYFLTFGAKSCFEDSISKTWKRLYPVKVEQPKEKIENVGTE